MVRDDDVPVLFQRLAHVGFPLHAPPHQARTQGFELGAQQHGVVFRIFNHEHAQRGQGFYE